MRKFTFTRLFNFPKRFIADNSNKINQGKSGQSYTDSSSNKDPSQNKDQEHPQGLTEKISDMAHKVTDTISQAANVAAEKIGIKSSGSTKDSYGSSSSQECQQGSSSSGKSGTSSQFGSPDSSSSSSQSGQSGSSTKFSPSSTSSQYNQTERSTDSGQPRQYGKDKTEYDTKVSGQDTDNLKNSDKLGGQKNNLDKQGRDWSTNKNDKL